MMEARLRGAPGAVSVDGTPEETPGSDRSLDFTEQHRRVVGEGLKDGTTDLRELTRRADARLGPYPESMHELGAGVRAHMVVLGPSGPV
jgi:hypothetical protein